MDILDVAIQMAVKDALLIDAYARTVDRLCWMVDKMLDGDVSVTPEQIRETIAAIRKANATHLRPTE